MRQKVAEMADGVLVHQAKTRAKRTGEPFEEALAAVMGTEPGRQLKELRDGPHHGETAQEWQEGLARKRERSVPRRRVGPRPTKSWAPRWTSHGGSEIGASGVTRPSPRPGSADQWSRCSSPEPVRSTATASPGGKRQGHRSVGGDPCRAPDAVPFLSAVRQDPALRGARGVKGEPYPP